MPATTSLKFQFSQEEADALNVPANGSGGFQSLIRQLQAAYDPTHRTIDMTDGMIGRVVRYLSYKPGGFEGRLASGFVRNITSIIQQ